MALGGTVTETDDGEIIVQYKIDDIGTVIGSHTAPGTVTLFFWEDERGE